MLEKWRGRLERCGDETEELRCWDREDVDKCMKEEEEEIYECPFYNKEVRVNKETLAQLTL